MRGGTSRPSAATDAPVCAGRLEVAIAHGRSCPSQRQQQLSREGQGVGRGIALTEQLSGPPIEQLDAMVRQWSPVTFGDLAGDPLTVSAHQATELGRVDFNADLRERDRPRLDAQRDGIHERAIEVEQDRLGCGGTDEPPSSDGCQSVAGAAPAGPMDWSLAADS